MESKELLMVGIGLFTSCDRLLVSMVVSLVGALNVAKVAAIVVAMVVAVVAVGDIIGVLSPRS